MKKSMAKIMAGAALLATLAGCAYTAPGVSGDKAVIVRNDSFLFGALRSIYVCKITDGGLTACAEGESP
jgi:hypothetical protein